ncbi:MAG TPA: response regulator, partial [Bryobacteraceae bacterium]|nr:response regulator [Bryobacteraceae bacterium]
MKITLLAIDDDPGSLALVAASVEQPELEILTCSNPVEALDIVRDRLPRIVICDLMMPEMTGIQVLEQIQQIDPTIDVILLTGHYSTESALEAIRKGACDYLVKPIAPDKLLDRVNQILSETRRLQDAAELDQKVLDTNRF